MQGIEVFRTGEMLLHGAYDDDEVLMTSCWVSILHGN